ncbi:Peroxiredoxin-6 [Strongyloides ratti]|uniref:1-Cys peroxiredoxin n=1 Tax=Strongyloides ratti TaxID=34506 RepID=A0A090MTV8_STRRB|nr:Peroxiredoxin-6 [Strongyloides ratti]CEF61798.1 Peroxiredoxin-6 [Strongyloides ratti]
MTLKLGDKFPNFSCITSHGKIDDFHQWLDSSWGILFSHPADFTPVCTTELAKAVELVPEFKKRNVKIIALSIDDEISHVKWCDDIIEYGKHVGLLENHYEKTSFPFPIIADVNRELATKLGMLDPEEIGSDGMPLTARAVFIIGPTKELKLSILYPATTGRNFDEILRVIDSLQLTSVKKVATPVNWKNGDKCMIIPSLSNEDAETLFGKNIDSINVPSKKNYLRLTHIHQ